MHHVCVWVFSIFHRLVNGESLTFLQERVLIELPLERQLLQQLCPIASGSCSRSDLLNRKFNVSFVRFTKNRVGGDGFVYVGTIASCYRRHLLVVGKLVLLGRGGKMLGGFGHLRRALVRREVVGGAPFALLRETGLL
jgi:hypothetical protein